MKTLLEFNTHIQAPVEGCFRLSLDTGLHVNSMRAHKEEAIAWVRNGVMQLHDTVTWKSRHFGIPLYMTSKITSYMAPYYFIDEMQKGPFRTFKHQHIFHVQADQSTLMTDLISYELPMGRLGRCLNKWLVKRYLESLIRERNVFLKQQAEFENNHDLCPTI